MLKCPCFLILALTISISSIAAEFTSFNINSDNGLPSNHVYFTLKDRYGYLWFATTNGVVKYNGYQLKIFDIADGLPTNDIWSLYEDKKGRIWCSATANELGYIYNDKYYRPFINYSDPSFYPYRLSEDPNGIVLITEDPASPAGRFCYERNDTINSIPFLLSSRHGLYRLNTDGELFCFKRNEILKVTREKNTLVSKHFFSSDILFSEQALNAAKYWIFNNWLLYYYHNDTYLNAINLSDNTQKRLNTAPNSFIYIVHTYPNSICVVGDKSTHRYDTRLNAIDFFPHKALSDKPFTDQVVHLLQDDFWGRIVATQRSGLFIHSRTKAKIYKPDTLKAFLYLGENSQKLTCWWDKSTGICIKDAAGHTTAVSAHRDKINKFVPYNETCSILLSEKIMELMDNRTGRTTSFFEKYKTVRDMAPDRIGAYNSQEYALSNGYVRDVAADDLGNLHAITTGYGYAIYKPSKDTLIAYPINRSKFKHILYDSYRKCVLAYTNRKIFCFVDGKEWVAESRFINSSSIKNISSVAVDNTYGNIFVKDYDKLLQYNPATHHYTEILQNFELINAFIFVTDNILVVAGQFGVLFSKISGPGIISDPLLYANNKNLIYDRVYAARIARETVLLETNKGAFYITIPEEIVPQKTANAYTLLCYYRGSVTPLQNNSIITVEQREQSITLDCIRPMGVGTPKYHFTIEGLDSSYRDLQGNELHFTHLKPGKKYNLWLITSDAVWKSSPIRVQVSVIPFWWQTQLGYWIIGIAAVIFLATILLLTIYMIKAKANKKNQQLALKNKNLTLELRSIHAQINPHFIFNTLNTGIYFIKNNKMEEAYEHIVTFSDLLRSYISSSRNKMITLGQEVLNLENYILLQQKRFEDKFDYEITVAENIDDAKSLLPSLLLQPLVENAIVHGLYHKKEKGHLAIRFAKSGNVLVCEIEDDGIGRQQSREINRSSLRSQSYGTDIVNDLITIFKELEQFDITINYKDKLLPDTGTTAIITIKSSNYE